MRKFNALNYYEVFSLYLHFNGFEFLEKKEHSKFLFEDSRELHNGLNFLY